MIDIIVKLPNGTITNRNYNLKDSIRVVKTDFLELLYTSYDNIGVLHDNTLL